MSRRLVRSRGVEAELVTRSRTATGRERAAETSRVTIRAIVASRAWDEDAQPGGEVRARTYARILEEDAPDAAAMDVSLVVGSRTWKVVEAEPARRGLVRLWLEYAE